MATVTNITYATEAAITISAWESLAAGAFASSSDIDNTSNLFVDALLGGEIAASAITIAAGESWDIYAAGRYDDDIATSYGGGIGVLLSAGEVLDVDVEHVTKNLKFLTRVHPEVTSPDTTQNYIWGPYSIAGLFGGILPQHYILILHNNTGSALTTGNVLTHVGVTYTHT